VAGCRCPSRPHALLNQPLQDARRGAGTTAHAASTSALEGGGHRRVTASYRSVHPAKNGFDYRLPDGALVRDIDTLRRIRSLVIPPAWTDVWICLDPNGHLQAAGRDQRGRKQYRYHSRWRDVRDEAKYGKLLVFAKALPLIRARVEADLQRRGLPREGVLAAIVRLMELTFFRVGNTEYAKANKSFGLTTLRDRHVAIEGGHIHISFRGKSGKQHETDINDRRLARIVKDCRDVPGYELSQRPAARSASWG